MRKFSVLFATGSVAVLAGCTPLFEEPEPVPEPQPVAAPAAAATSAPTTTQKASGGTRTAFEATEPNIAPLPSENAEGGGGGGGGGTGGGGGEGGWGG